MKDNGASSGPGSRASTEPASSLGRSGFDPSRDDSLIENAVHSARPRYRTKAPRWVAVMDVFNIGRTSALELCARFCLDPDEERTRR